MKFSLRSQASGIAPPSFMRDIIRGEKFTLDDEAKMQAGGTMCKYPLSLSPIQLEYLTNGIATQTLRVGTP